MSRLTSRQIETHHRLQSDFEFFAKVSPLKILPKEGGVIQTLELNRAQKYAHDMAERQLQETGWVRIIVVKGRQQGMSTYIEARFYHKTTRQKGTNAFIITHLDDATKNLFEMVKRYHDNVDPRVRPKTAHSNEKELVFADLDSRYAVATAGSKAAGRSRTNRLFHGSEVAYWENTKDIRKGALQTVPGLRGTEIWLESTANGMGNMFHQMAIDALNGRGDFQLCFVPWFWQPEYSREIPDDFELNQEELEYRDLYDLSLGQMAWRRAKIVELESVDAFKREYPATVHEAFEVSGGGLIKPTHIMKARQSEITDKPAPLILGVDPARDGDRTVITFRRGREVPAQHVWDPSKGETMNEMKLVGIVGTYIKEHKPAAVFIDVAYGHGAIDRLHELGFDDVVHGVHFGESATNSQVYLNKRAEMYGDMADWLAGHVSIPNCDQLHQDLAIIPDFKLNSSSRKVLTPKEKIKKEFGFSPDMADSLALTFAYPVQHANSYAASAGKRESNMKTRSRLRKGR